MKKKGKSKVKNKDLEKDITSKFMDVVHGLGHDAEKLKKEIAKAGKAVSKKITSSLQAAKTKAEQTTDKPEKKAGKKVKPAKTEVAKADSKAEKVLSKASKAAGDKTKQVSGLSVAKPALPAIDKTETPVVKKEVVKEAPAPVAPAKKRAPRRSKEEMEASKPTEKTPVKEASTTSAKRKRASRKPAPAVTAAQPATEAADRETAASTLTD
ncbi:hypothetical protein [Mucilaginibacter arboris]|uniref:Histone H1/5 n=1 Tax=Mucilaginibacter arboris TaxID=2682090 RepID=A0A7K1SU38_9SPHI|nr:hypothetical protein [Mucilaginibacter arboris]MVN20831.1 hypothetical protein [Mucilaginibacter arboris]